MPCFRPWAAPVALIAFASLLSACSDDDAGSGGDGGPDSGVQQDGGGSGTGAGGAGGSGSVNDGGGAAGTGNGGAGGGRDGGGASGSGGKGGGNDGGAGTGGSGQGGSGGTGGSDDEDDVEDDSVCNGEDGDGDGKVDEGYEESETHCGVGECRRSGTMRCRSGGREDDTCEADDAPSSSDTSCNGQDDDCDGDTDEDYDSVDCDGEDDDECEEGETSCDDGEVECDDDSSDTKDVCDGVDNDCDSTSADGSEDPDQGDDCDGDDGDECDEGTLACVGGDMECDDESSDEVDTDCDGEDDDCDGTDDESYVSVGCDGVDTDSCNEGVTTCTGGSALCDDESSSTTDNDCNDVNEDCDANTDEGYPSVACDGADTDSCVEGTTSCSSGDTVCSDSTGSTVDNDCDNVDDDCDASTDESYVSVACDGADADECLEGTTSCNSGGNLACSDATGATVDTDCDGDDEDCDGEDDEGYVPDDSCGVGYCHTTNTQSSCTGGTETACQAGSSLGADTTCNDVDDDCSGEADEDYVEQSCGLGACLTGSTSSSCAAGGVETACDPGDPVGSADTTCDGIDDDCDGDVDEEYVITCNGALNGLLDCVGGDTEVIPCSDTVGCTVDTCNPDGNGDLIADDPVCGSEPNDAACASDGFDCTSEICVIGVGCSQVPDNQFCRDEDGSLCNGLEACNPTGAGHDGDGCVPGTPPCADDQWNCTDTQCSEGPSGVTCSQVPDNDFCDDDLFCTGAEVCNPASASRDADGCVDGPTCPGTEDGASCTQVTCNEGADSCSNTPIVGACTDGNNCTTDVCSPGVIDANPVTGCRFTPVNCAATPGTNECTTAVCDNSDGSCILVTDASSCPGGQACTVEDGCVSCVDDAECGDGDACNGDEVCAAGTCAAGTPPPPCANDGFSCTVEQCNPLTGACDVVLDNDLCTDPQGVCNGADACNPSGPGHDSLGCTHGAALDCDDGAECTVDDCDPVLGCSNSDDGFCAANDLTVCDGEATCIPGDPDGDVNGCVEPFPDGIDCEQDSIACTVGVCEEPTGCREVPDKTECPCGQTCDTELGCQNTCVPATCGANKTYACGDCLDNDGDCTSDPLDPNSGIDTGSDLNCLGPCQDNEAGLAGLIPGQNNAPCKMDCYFDADSGAGNDGCKWDHECDPFLPGDPVKCNSLHDVQLTGGNPKTMCWASTPAPPRPASIPSSAGIAGYSNQPTSCWDFTPPVASGDNYCGPLVPNGCDCFGCCAIPGVSHTIYLGSTNTAGVQTCTLDTVNDPTKCKQCTQVPGCLNTCEHCEVCVGKPLPEADCSCQVCRPGVQLCGAPCGTQCDPGFYCNTGCCTPVPQ